MELTYCINMRAYALNQGTNMDIDQLKKLAEIVNANSTPLVSSELGGTKTFSFQYGDTTINIKMKELELLSINLFIDSELIEFNDKRNSRYSTTLYLIFRKKIKEQLGLGVSCNVCKTNKAQGTCAHCEQPTCQDCHRFARIDGILNQLCSTCDDKR